MPMPNNGFQWRPNDNSAVTNLRYTLEAEKWVGAVSSAQRRAAPRSVAGDLAFIGMLLELVLSVSLLILLGILQLIKGLIYLVEVNVRKNNGSASNRQQRKRSLNLTANFEKPNVVVWDLSNEKEKPGRPAHNMFYSYGTLRPFWQFLFMFVGIFLIEIIALGILSHFYPQHFQIGKEILIFAGCVSAWFAFTGMD